MGIFIQVILLVIGFVMLIKGADWFVEGASKLADRFGIPQIIIGLTIVAMGTSAPEAAVSIAAAMKGTAEITIGNVVGSNILNILLILGLTAVIIPLSVNKNTFRIEIPFVIVVSTVLFGLGWFDGSLSRFDGAVLLALFVVFLVYLFVSAKKGSATAEEIESGSQDKIWKMLLMIVIGGVLIVWGSNVTVDAATAIAKFFGWSDRLIGLTIVAFGTSLPELITSVTAGMKGKADIAVGNIVGSNIFNILFVVGLTALITPVPYAASFLVDSIMCIATAGLLFVAVLFTKGKNLNRFSGATMLGVFAVYFVYLLMNANA